jgi:hypothetical protein
VTSETAFLVDFLPVNVRRGTAEDYAATVRKKPWTDNCGV